LKRILIRVIRFFEFASKSAVLKILKKFTFRYNKSISIELDSTASVDGSGAQIQRLLSIYALAKYFGFSYRHNSIKQISVHPLDPFQSADEYRDYIERVNELFLIENSPQETPLEEIRHIREFRFLQFIGIVLKGLLLKSRMRISILNPYSITEFCPSAMLSIGERIQFPRGGERLLNTFRIVLHYRQGVGGFQVYPGQAISRETPLEEFIPTICKSISRYQGSSNIEIRVVTDAPAEETTFHPPHAQTDLWQGSPAFKNGEMRIQPMMFDLIEERTGIRPTIIRGGSPLEAISEMAQANVLLMSRSSLSYIGAVLNLNGEIYFPKRFWHRKMKHWRFL
jgi:hypothetical protein